MGVKVIRSTNSSYSGRSKTTLNRVNLTIVPASWQVNHRERDFRALIELIAVINYIENFFLLGFM